MRCQTVYVIFVIFLHADAIRTKRFFHKYFASTETTEVSKFTSRPIYVFDNEYLCNQGSREYCNSSEIVKKESSTPVTYLTPPTRDIFKYGDQGFGYTYPTVRIASDDKKNSYQQRNVYDTELKVSVNDAICIRSTRNARFSVVMITSKNVASPVIENNAAENLPQCSVTTLNSTAFQINIHDVDLIGCGVYYCSTETESNLMCLTVRFPLISGIKTSDDVSVRIQCRPQPQLLSHVKQLQLKPSHLNVNLGRALPLMTTVSGNSPSQELHSDVFLYALTSTGYTQLVRNNDVVTIGEDVQLRGIIRQGDGWHYARFGKVIVQRVLAPSSGYYYGENPDSIVVVADDGCVNSAMKSICPNAPFNDPENPLISMLNMKMFIFNNMKDGDELSMLVTMYGCVNYEDCFAENNCQGWQKGFRVKRSSQNEINGTVDSTSEIKIRIKTNTNKSKLISCDEQSCEKIDDSGERSVKMLMLFICCIIGLTACVVYHCSVSLIIKNKFHLFHY